MNQAPARKPGSFALAALPSFMGAPDVIIGGRSREKVEALQ
jgi:hypothetical protein